MLDRLMFLRQVVWIPPKPPPPDLLVQQTRKRGSKGSEGDQLAGIYELLESRKTKFNLGK